MQVGDRVMFVSVVLARSLGLAADAVGVIMKVHEHPVIPDRLDVAFPGVDTLVGRTERDFVEVNALS